MVKHGLHVWCQGWVEQGREIFDQDEDGRIAELELRENYDLNNISHTGIFPDKVGNSIYM